MRPTLMGSAFQVGSTGEDARAYIWQSEIILYE